MKPPASSIANVSSDSNDPPANSPPATTSQNGARSSATGRRPGATPGLPAVIIPPGSRLTDHQATYSDLPTGDHSVVRRLVAATTPNVGRCSTPSYRPPSMSLVPPVGVAVAPRLPLAGPLGPVVGPQFVAPIPPTAAFRRSSNINTRSSSPLPAIHAVDAMSASHRGSGLVEGVLADVNGVERANTHVNGPLPPFVREYVTTSASSLVAILAKQSFLGVDDPNLAQPKPIVVVPESKLRALFMKALLWFINREGVNVDGAVVVFVGKKVHGNAFTRHLALPLATVRKLANEFGAAGGDPAFDLEFEEFGARSLQAGQFYVEYGGWAVPIAGILVITGLCALIFLYTFLRDVATLLILLPHAL